jgi:hypothetical protein
LTQISPLDVEGLLAALEGAAVHFVVIGGFAVGAHGYPRATKDLDIVPDPDPENLERLASLLTDLNASVLGMPRRRWFSPIQLAWGWAVISFSRPVMGVSTSCS